VATYAAWSQPPAPCAPSSPSTLDRSSALVGALFGFYLQHPEYLRSGERELQPTARLRERLALSAMLLVGRAFAGRGERCTVASLADALAVPSSVLGPIVDVLEAAGLLATGTGEALLPGRDPDRITLDAVLAAVRDGPSGRALTLRQARLVDVAERACDDVDAEISARLGRLTLQQLIDRGH